MREDAPGRRPRRSAEPGEFADPLSDYSPPQYADRLEEELGELTVQDMEAWPPIIVSPEDTVEHCAKLMAEEDFGCVLVVDHGKLIGIFSERDVLNKVAEDYPTRKQLPVGVVMTHDPVVVYATDPPAKALNIMAVGSVRHVPILDLDDQVVGVLGPRRVTAFLMRHF